MAEDPNSRIALLNHLVSLSKTRNRKEQPPTVDGYQLLSMIHGRFRKGIAIEYQGEDSEADDKLRIQKNTGKNYLRIRDMLMPPAQRGASRYAALLLEFWDAKRQIFHVADPITFEGRSLKGEGAERGVITAALMVKLPPVGEYDEGKYRCVIEAVPSISRGLVEHFLCRQVRRETDRDQWTYPVERAGLKGKVKTLTPRYTPRLELHAGGIGRKINGSGAGSSILKSLTFTKRDSRESTGGATEIKHTDFVADLRVHISASQGPKEVGLLRQWSEKICQYYEGLGFKTTYAFRSAEGEIASGEIHPSLSGATDLLLCQRETINYAQPREIWETTLRQDVVDCLREVLDRDELWERPE